MSRLEVRVTPRASSNRIEGVDAAGRVKIKVTAPPVEGAANLAVVRLMAKALGVSVGKVAVVRGKTSRNKTLEIDGLSMGELQNLLVKNLE